MTDLNKAKEVAQRLREIPLACVDMHEVVSTIFELVAEVDRLNVDPRLMKMVELLTNANKVIDKLADERDKALQEVERLKADDEYRCGGPDCDGNCCVPVTKVDVGPVAWGMCDPVGNVVETISPQEKQTNMKLWADQYNIPLVPASALAAEQAKVRELLNVLDFIEQMSLQFQNDVVPTTMGDIARAAIAKYGEQK